MEKFQLNILGCGSATCTTQHLQTSQVLDIRDNLLMIDCGEGTQLQMRRMHLKFARLNNIFISHLHGDHCFGLMGLISTFGLLGRTATLHIYAHCELEKLLAPQLEFFCKGMTYDVEFHAINPNKAEVIYDDRSVSISTIPLRHRIPTCGFLFLEKKRNQEPIKRYAYCSDTRYNLGMIEQIQGVQTLFHESTFSEKLALRAAKAGHSTAKQAADIALRSGTQKLIIGHFSARIPDHQEFLVEAQEIFPDTVLAVERTTIDI